MAEGPLLAAGGPLGVRLHGPQVVQHVAVRVRVAVGKEAGVPGVLEGVGPGQAVEVGLLTAHAWAPRG